MNLNLSLKMICVCFLLMNQLSHQILQVLHLLKRMITLIKRMQYSKYLDYCNAHKILNSFYLEIYFHFYQQCKGLMQITVQYQNTITIIIYIFQKNIRIRCQILMKEISIFLIMNLLLSNLINFMLINWHIRKNK